jgi:hypothetical protein
MDGICRLEELLAMLRSRVGARVLARTSRRESVRLAAVLHVDRAIDEEQAAPVANALEDEVKALWKADARYWKPVIHELELLRRAGRAPPRRLARRILTGPA